MATETVTIHRPSRDGEPLWEALEFLPRQGSWSEEAYLETFHERGVEYVDGRIEVLPLPTMYHQDLLVYLFDRIRELQGTGKTYFMGYRIRLPIDCRAIYREPDVMYLTAEQQAAARNKATDAATLIAEVISPDDRQRDLIDKRSDYAAARIPEYWIIDPAHERVLLLVLDGDAYTEHVLTRGEIVTSRVLPELHVDVAVLLDRDSKPQP